MHLALIAESRSVDSGISSCTFSVLIRNLVNTKVWEKWVNAELLFHCHKNCDCIGSQETGACLLGVSIGSQHGHIDMALGTELGSLH